MAWSSIKMLEIILFHLVNEKMVKAEDNNAGMEIPDTRYANRLYTGKNQNEVKITTLNPEAILEQG